MTKSIDDILADQSKRDGLRPTPRLERVECGRCGWTGKRKPGNFVICPKCGFFAAFQCERSER